MGRDRWLHGVGAVLVALAGLQAVGTTAAAADAPLVHGRVLTPAGKPAAGLRVVLEARGDTTTDLVGAFGAVATLGLTCVAGAPPCEAVKMVEARTGTDGRFAFTGVDAAKVGVKALVLIGSDPGPTIAVEISIDQERDLEDLRQWDPKATLAKEGASTRVAWQAPAGADGNTVVDGTVLAADPVGGGDAEVARVKATGATGSGAYDRRALEDRPGTLVLGAGFSRPRGKINTRVDWGSGRIEVPGAGAPLSRGKPCAPGGTPATRPCPVTDGDLRGSTCQTAADPTTVPPCDSGTAADVVVDLGRAQPVGLLTAIAGAGLEDPTLATSVDARTWTPAAHPPQGGAFAATFADAGGAKARYVRAARPAGEQVSALEVSAWPPGDPPSVVVHRPPTAPAAPAVAAPGRHGATG